MDWENIYTDLSALTIGDCTGYVELFKNDNGKYHWEVLRDAKLVTMGESSSPESAKKTVERRLELLK